MVDGNRRGTPTTYRGVRMRSRLEAMVASWLDNRRIPWEYEPQCFADERGQYYPDFRVQPIRVCGIDRATLYVEVKPAGFVTGHVGELLDRMDAIWATDPAAFNMICTPDDAGFWKFPMRWTSHDEVWEVSDGGWLECLRCHGVGVDTLSRVQAPFTDLRNGVPTVEPWVCPSCCRNCGFEVATPWTSAEYHAMVSGNRLAG